MQREDTGTEQVLGIYHKAEIVKAYQQDLEEMMWLSGGVLSELKQLRKLSIDEYYNLMKYVIDKNNDELKRHQEILNSRQNG